MKVALAATIQDVAGRLIPAIARNADAFRAAFDGIAINITDTTAPSVVDAVRAHLGASTMTHRQGEAIIGRARRDAARLALEFPADAILHCDFDHMLRWVETDAAELAAIHDYQPGIDMLVVGRTAHAFAAEPARLRETERIVNHIYDLMTGRPWDLMFAVRRLSRRCAEGIVRDSRIDTIANDVEWPLLAERAGQSLGYAQAGGLYYRAMDDFGTAADTHDAEPGEWIRRIEIATLHADVEGLSAQSAFGLS
jgi:hypothetical protein